MTLKKPNAGLLGAVQHRALKDANDSLDHSQEISAGESRALQIRKILEGTSDPSQKEALTVKLIAEQLPDKIRKQYAALLSQLNLSKDNEDQLVDLLVTRELLRREALADVSATEITVKVKVPSSPLNSTLKEITLIGNYGDLSSMDSNLAQVDDFVNAKVLELLDQDGYALYSEAVDTAYLRNRLSSITQRITEAGVTPLKESQTSALLQAMIPENTPRRYYQQSVITAGVMQSAQEYLTADQLKIVSNIAQYDATIDAAAAIAVQLYVKNNKLRR